MVTDPLLTFSLGSCFWRRVWWDHLVRSLDRVTGMRGEKIEDLFKSFFLSPSVFPWSLLSSLSSTHFLRSSSLIFHHHLRILTSSLTHHRIFPFRLLHFSLFRPFTCRSIVIIATKEFYRAILGSFSPFQCENIYKRALNAIDYWGYPLFDASV